MILSAVWVVSLFPPEFLPKPKNPGQSGLWYPACTRSFPPPVASAAPVVQAVAVSVVGGSYAGVLGGDA